MRNKEIKIAFFDIDWTLYDHKAHRFTPSSIRAIKRLNKLGVKVIIATARPISSMTFLGVFKNFKVDGVISYGGGYVKYQDTELIKNIVKKEKILEFIKIAKYNDVCLELINVDTAYLVTPMNDALKEYSRIYKEEPLCVKEYDETKDVVGGVLYLKEDYDHLFKDIKETHLNRYCALAIEFLNKEYKKGDGVKAVLNHLNLNKENAICFGDDLNDIDMFNECKYSVAMGNGKPELKEVSYFVTSRIEKHGIKKGLKKFKVI